ncbi:ComF family protein, partial [bacterium]|nr:ComF family protein [bacterium]MBU1985046.1 ComF family protein [bacterium]
RASVHALKYRGMRLVAEPMSRHLVSRLPIRFVEPEVVWTPVPLHWRRWLSRGYNQSAILARALADTVSHESPRILLRRRRNTPTQTARSYRERHANVRNAFEVPHGMNVPEAVLLIDDVITTGATVEECARVLKDAGAKWVGAFAFGLTHNG